MKKSIAHAPRRYCICALFACCSEAELQNVDVGGSIEIYGAYYSEFFADRDRLIWPDFLMPRRAIGPTGTITYVDNDGHGPNTGFVEQRTKLNLRADFTDNVAAFIELDSVWNWGDDFSSDYRDGGDRRAVSDGDPSIFQAYVEVEDLFGLPARLRVGRQTLALGHEWLVGTNSDPDPFIEVSFDALRFTIGDGPLTADLWAAKLGENGVNEQDGDVDFYGAYATWNASEALAIDAYYMFLRDARSIRDTNFAAPIEWLEDVADLDNYDSTTLHTAGLALYGAWNQFDYYAEAAYQWGEADALGAQFRLPGQLYGDNNARFGSFGSLFEFGYTFDVNLTPRVFVTGAYFGSDDRRDLSYADFLNPFSRPQASVSFNRLFSSYRPTHFLDYSALSNFWLLRAGIEFTITEKLSVSLDAMNYRVVEALDVPHHIRLGDFRIPTAPALPFRTKQGDDNLGIEIMLAPTYAYSEDLAFSMQFVYHFLGGAYTDGVFLDENGSRFIGGSGDEDAVSATMLMSLAF